MHYRKIDKLLRDGDIDDIFLCKEIIKDFTYNQAKEVFNFNIVGATNKHLLVSTPGNKNAQNLERPIINFGNFGIGIFVTGLILIKKEHMSSYHDLIHDNEYF